MIQRIDLRLSNLEDGTVPFADISIDTQGDALVITNLKAGSQSDEYTM